MNIHATPKPQLKTTRAAEGFGRRLFSVKEILAMEEAEIFDPSEKFELVEGEIVPKGPGLSVHEAIKLHFNEALVLARSKEFLLGVETAIYLSDHTFLLPDLCLFPRHMPTADVRGADIVLAIEVAVTSLRYDRKLKASVYARYGVPEYWVIDAVQRRTFIHTGPTGDTWTSIAEHGPEFELTIAAVPGFRQRLADI